MSDLNFSSATSNSWKVFTPTVTLVGGAGNTVPVYVTNAGYYYKITNLVFVQLFLDGDGGANGAGTGQINIALPFTSSANQPANNFVVGKSSNGATGGVLYGNIAANATTVSLIRQNGAATNTNFTGADQNSATRNIRCAFFYMV